MYGFQININGEWLWVSTGGVRYEFDTEAKAYNAMSMCYPDQLREQRLGGTPKVRVQQLPEINHDH